MAKNKKRKKKKRKVIFHLDLDAFFASVEMANNPEYKKVPLIVGGRTKKAVVSTCNYLARSFGIKAGMPIFKALELCPQATVLNANYELYEQYSDDFIKIIKKTFCRKCEQISIDECFLDVTKLIKKDMLPIKLAKIIQQTIFKKLKITVSIGISYNKFLAKMASDWHKPCGITVINKKDVEKKIWRLPINKMYFVGKATAIAMHELGIKTIGDLAKYENFKLLEAIFGSAWFDYYLNAHGFGDDFVSTNNSPPKSLSIQFTLPSQTSNIQELEEWLKYLSQQLSQKTQFHGVFGHVVYVYLKCANRRMITKQISIKEPTDRYDIIYQHASFLLNEHYQRSENVRLIGIGLGKLTTKPCIRQRTIF